MDNIKYKITCSIDGGNERDVCYIKNLVIAARLLSSLTRNYIDKGEIKLNKSYIDNFEFRIAYKVKLIVERDNSFNLKEEYKKLKVKEFIPGIDNYYMVYNYWEDSWDIRSYKELLDIESTYYEYEGLERFVGLLYDNRVKLGDLEKVIKEVREEKYNGD